MMSVVKGRLFEETLRLFGREYALEVFVMTYPNQTNYYRCILDDIKVVDLWIDDNGQWIDLQAGHTEISKIIGSRIEEKVLPPQLSIAH
ncbi:hypothetical protein [Segetibacter aerophilus]|uniref:Uncharacterized protein n=1 Tax=Segetibacter aerophilus TaxID=670293 RepID=A0A512B9V6_9BACT|nr:hypothetical protein [Segetibacter aerophilus]GEO08741.1 hypothetical protein SAE01_12370 [Segetibacter aerophilus]